MIELEDLVFVSLVGSHASEQAYPLRVDWAHTGSLGTWSMDLRPAADWGDLVSASVRSGESPTSAVWLPEAGIRLQERFGRHVVLSDRVQRDTLLLDRLYEGACMVRPFPVGEVRDIYESFIAERSLASNLRARAEATAAKAFSTENDEKRASPWLLRFMLVDRYARANDRYASDARPVDG